MSSRRLVEPSRAWPVWDAVLIKDDLAGRDSRFKLNRQSVFRGFSGRRNEVRASTVDHAQTDRRTVVDLKATIRYCIFMLEIGRYPPRPRGRADDILVHRTSKRPGSIHFHG